MDYEIQEYKVWKGIRLDSPVWAGLGYIRDDWSSLNQTMEYLERNNPDRIYRIHKWQGLR